jgi:hypothetical protein
MGVDRVVSNSLLVVRRLLETGAARPPGLAQLLGRVQELLPPHTRFVRVGETFIFLLCALVDRPVPAAMDVMVQGCRASLLGIAHHFMHASLRGEWTIGLLYAVAQFVKQQRSWAYGRSRAVLAPALKHLSNPQEHFLVLAQTCSLI